MTTVNEEEKEDGKKGRWGGVASNPGTSVCNKGERRETGIAVGKEEWRMTGTQVLADCGEG